MARTQGPEQVAQLPPNSCVTGSSFLLVLNHLPSLHVEPVTQPIPLSSLSTRVPEAFLPSGTLPCSFLGSSSLPPRARLSLSLETFVSELEKVLHLKQMGLSSWRMDTRLAVFIHRPQHQNPS